MNVSRHNDDMGMRKLGVFAVLCSFAEQWSSVTLIFIYVEHNADV